MKGNVDLTLFAKFIWTLGGKTRITSFSWGSTLSMNCTTITWCTPFSDVFTSQHTCILLPSTHNIHTHAILQVTLILKLLLIQPQTPNHIPDVSPQDHMLTHGSRLNLLLVSLFFWTHLLAWLTLIYIYIYLFTYLLFCSILLLLIPPFI